MKNLSLIRFLFLCFILFSCQPKKEKKQPIIYNNSNQNYKYDDDDSLHIKTKESKDRKQNLEGEKSDPVQR